MEFIKLSAVVFTRAQRVWYTAVGLDGLAFAVVAVSILLHWDTKDPLSTYIAGVVAIMGLVAYACHVYFVRQYKLAWRIRRHGILSFGLNRLVAE